MVTMMSTKLTKGGQTTVPKEVRTALGIADGARVLVVRRAPRLGVRRAGGPAGGDGRG